jgi:hypothetical protein
MMSQWVTALELERAEKLLPDQWPGKSGQLRKNSLEEPAPAL